MKKWKKTLFMLITIAVVLRISYICIRGETDRQYVVSSFENLSDAPVITCENLEQKFFCMHKHLDSLEIFFSDISDEDKTGNITLALISEDGLLYQTNISLVNINNGEWKKIYVNAELDTHKEYILRLDSSEDCKQIPKTLLVPENHAVSEALSSYADGYPIDGQIAVRYGYLQPPEKIDRVVLSSIWLVFWVIVLILLIYNDLIYSQLKKGLAYIFTIINRRIFFFLVEIFGTLIIVSCSGIEFQPPTKIILYLLSICASVKFDEKRKYIKKICNTPVKTFFTYFLSVYGAFSLVGQRILIYPLNLNITLGGMFVFTVTVIWFIPVIWTALYLLEGLSTVACNKKQNFHILAFTGVVLVLLLLPAIYHLYANNPGISSPDTYATMYNAHHIRGMSDWHPAFYCIVLKTILAVWDSTYMVIIVQYFFWAYVMIELLLYLRKKGMNDALLIGAALLSGINAANFVHINTIWKDIPYALSVLWVLIICAKLSIDFDEYKSKWYIYAELIVALIGVFFYRKNGVVTFSIIVIMMIISLYKNRKIWCTIALTMIIVMTIKGPVYTYFEIASTGRVGMYIGLGQDLLGVYYAGGEISESTLQMITIMTGYNNAEYDYTPTWARQSYDLVVEPGVFIINYIDTFLKNPVLMIRAVLAREDALWNIYAGLDSVLGCVNYNGTYDGMEKWNEYYPERTYNSLYNGVLEATNYTATTQWISAIEWRSGLSMLLGMLAILFVGLKTDIKKHILLTAPIIGHIFSLLLSTGWSDFRYFWPVNLMNMALLLLSITITSKACAERNHL